MLTRAQGALRGASTFRDHGIPAVRYPGGYPYQEGARLFPPLTSHPCPPPRDGDQLPFPVDRLDPVQVSLDHLGMADFAGWTESAWIVHDDQGAYFEINVA